MHFKLAAIDTTFIKIEQYLHMLWQFLQLCKYDYCI